MATIVNQKGCKYYLSATVEPEMVKRIDALRGEIPRSRIVDRALSQYLDNVEGLANKNNTQALGERRNNS